MHKNWVDQKARFLTVL